MCLFKTLEQEIQFSGNKGAEILIPVVTVMLAASSLSILVVAAVGSVPLLSFFCYIW